MAEVVLDLIVPGRRDAGLPAVWTAAIGPPVGWAWVQHGFARRGGHLSGLAHLLASAGIASVRTDIGSFTPWRSMHDRVFLTAATLTLMRSVESGIPQSRGIEIDGPLVGIGHSAGCAVLAHALTVLDARGGESFAGVIMIDPVDTVGRLVQDSLPALRSESIEVFSLPPSRCNRQGATSALLAQRTRARITALTGLSHADPERIPARLDPSAVPPPSRVAGWVCGPPGSPQAVVDLGGRVLEAVRARVAP